MKKIESQHSSPYDSFLKASAYGYVLYAVLLTPSENMLRIFSELLSRFIKQNKYRGTKAFRKALVILCTSM